MASSTDGPPDGANQLVFASVACTASSTLDMDSLQLFFVVTILGLFYSFIPLIVKTLMTLLGAATKEELDLMSQVSEMKKKMHQISMVDEFARYAKLQREINKLKDQLKSRGTEKNMFLFKLKYGSNILMYLIYSSISVYISWNYRSQPLLRLPNGIFHPFYPIGYILAFPCGVQGAIGVAPWLAITIFTGRKLRQACHL